jgi:hypothetical protein
MIDSLAMFDRRRYREGIGCASHAFFMQMMELARAIFGRDGYQQRINSDCNLLLSRGPVERRGIGGASVPTAIVQHRIEVG